MSHAGMHVTIKPWNACKLSCNTRTSLIMQRLLACWLAVGKQQLRYAMIGMRNLHDMMRAGKGMHEMQIIISNLQQHDQKGNLLFHFLIKSQSELEEHCVIPYVGAMLLLARGEVQILIVPPQVPLYGVKHVAQGASCIVSSLSCSPAFFGLCSSWLLPHLQINRQYGEGKVLL